MAFARNSIKGRARHGGGCGCHNDSRIVLNCAGFRSTPRRHQIDSTVGQFGYAVGRKSNFRGYTRIGPLEVRKAPINHDQPRACDADRSKCHGLSLQKRHRQSAVSTGANEAFRGGIVRGAEAGAAQLEQLRERRRGGTPRSVGGTLESSRAGTFCGPFELEIALRSQGPRGDSSRPGPAPARSLLRPWRPQRARPPRIEEAAWEHSSRLREGSGRGARGHMTDDIHLRAANVVAEVASKVGNNCVEFQVLDSINQQLAQ